MKMARKLRDMVTSVEEKPTVKVPPTDKGQSLAVAAADGIAAVHALYDERNKSVELAQSLHRHNVYLANVNNQLRGELHHAKQERDQYMRLNSRVQAWVIQAHDLLGLIRGAVSQCVEVVEHMEPAPPAPVTPNAPKVDVQGIPVGYDSDGLPTQHEGPPDVDAAELHELIKRLGANGEVTAPA